MRQKSIRTLDDLRGALLALIEGKGHASATKHTNLRVSAVGKTTSHHYSGFLTWNLPQQYGGDLTVCEAGHTLPEAFDNCRRALKREIEERTRKRQLSAQAKPVLSAPPPRRLTYQEAGKS